MRPDHFGAEDFRAALNLSFETLAKFVVYHDLLVKWQRQINLVSNSTLGDSWRRHFYDSAQILQYFPKDASVIADLGSGAGFPGLVIKLLNPGLNVNLVESDQRKCLFLSHVSRETGVHVSIHNERIERVSESFLPDVVTARALADLGQLLDFASFWTRNNKNLQMILLKGENADKEIEGARSLCHFDSDSYRSLTHPKAQVLRIYNVACE